MRRSVSKLAKGRAVAGPRAVAYLRVSRGEQDWANQRPDVEQLARARGFALLSQYVENVSAAARVRPAFESMMEAARLGKFDVLLVWALDRFGRSMVGNVAAVLELDRLGVQVVSVKEAWLDSGGPVRSLLIAIFSWIAEQERVRLGERTRAGLERARARGVRLGRPPSLGRAQLAHARRLERRGNLSIREIARQVGVSSSAIYRALKGPR